MNSSATMIDQVLFGADPTEGIVAVEPLGQAHMRLFLRRGGELRIADEPFTPFVLVEDERLLDDFHPSHRIELLSGAGAFRFLVLFERWGDCERARDHLRRVSGEPASSQRAPYLFLSDPVHQHLLLTGKTLFKGLEYADIHRLAIDIETSVSEGFEFPNPAREEDRIVSIALMDNRGYSEVLFGSEMDEKTMLETLGERIARLDPDVVEGHNIFNFDLEYIVARAGRRGVALRWGRDGSRPRSRSSRFTLAERTIDFTRMDIFGRHIVDTLFLLQHYDVSARALESYGLKAAALHFGLAAEDRTYINHRDITRTYVRDPEALKRYNLDDVRETLALSELLGYSFFLQARIFPFSYQNIFIRGNATRIDSIFLREYLRRRVSIPRPVAAVPFAGGYTDVFEQGVVRDIVHCDVTSLYPSLMLAFDLKPATDSEEIFLPLLRDLRTFRLEARRKARAAGGDFERRYFEAMQQTFKILINSFYGYLGTSVHHFSDPALAAEVTRRGREIIRGMVDWLRREGARPVEIDTDGIYFVPPPGVETEGDASALVRRLSGSLPEGIDVEMAGRYPAMFSYKMKNYALLDDSGAVVIKGSGLRSRGMERYLRDFLAQLLRLLLEGRSGEVLRVYGETLEKLERHELDISLLAKTETLSESPDGYLQKVRGGKRNRSAAYELAIASGRDYRAGDQVTYYVTGDGKKVRVYDNCRFASAYDPAAPDENVPYYRAKLGELLEKFRPFLPGEGR